MQGLKPYPFVLSVIVILTGLAGCTGNIPNPTATSTLAAPTSTAALPTAVESELSETPDLRAQPGEPGIGDSFYPYLGNGGYDVQHYTLDLTVNDVKDAEFEGVTTIEAIATQNLSSFNLDFNGFVIAGVTVNGIPAEHKRDHQELTIIPPVPLVENQSFVVEIRYQGSPQTMLSVALPIRVGWVTYEGGSYVFSEPDGAMNFFPVNNHPLDKATYTFHVTVPKPFEVAANGVLTGTTEDGSTTTSTFEMSTPMASYLATIDIGQFDLETSQTANGIPIRNYFSSGLPEGIRTAFDRQGEMLDYYSDIFGPYPFDVYGVLVLDTEVGGALEDQTLSIFGIHGVERLEKGFDEIVAHELSHQWFGDSVSVADWHDIWLNESFASYAQGLWVEREEGREALDQWIRETYRSVIQNRQHMTPPGEPDADNLFNGGVYQWGALCLHALRLEVGDEEFFKILKTYYKDYEGGNATTADFIAVAEEVSGRELNPFFDRWLYSDELAPIPSLGLEPNP